jgi:hypothetical protein
VPDSAACRDILRRASLSCAASAAEAADVRAGTNPVCRRDGDGLQTAGPVAVALDLFDRGREHPVTFDQLFRSAVRIGAWGRRAQSYVGKSAVLKGIAAAYGSILAGSHDPRVKPLASCGGWKLQNPRRKRCGRLTPAWTRGVRPAAKPSAQQPCA